jgi:[FeFe] hydrogenase H-cluster maturation GTPase HydF
LYKAVKGERLHIAVVGRRNVGKSSLINLITGQELSIVNEIARTTTEPIAKVVELMPYGPVVLVDTVGIDDEGDIGKEKINKTIKTISNADFVIVVLDARERLSEKEIVLFNYLNKICIPYIVVVNKIEFGINQNLLSDLKGLNGKHYEVSCKEKIGFESIKRNIIRRLPIESETHLIADIVGQGDTVMMVVPADQRVPKGSLIKSQAQSVREALDRDTIAVVVKSSELPLALNNLNRLPDLVITDSRLIMNVMKTIPANVKLTTFSILLARNKGNLSDSVNALKQVEELQNGDKILIAEACTKHEQIDDIGLIKIPYWLRAYTKKKLFVDIKKGIELPENLSQYKLIIHCGGCMISRKTLQARMKTAKLLDVPVVDYGVIISYLHGVVPRVLEPFDEAIEEWERITVH